VFRIYDTRTGQVEDVSLEPGSVLRVYAHGPARGRPAHFGELRSLLVADLILRNAEHRHGLTVVACLVVPGAGNDEPPAADATALNIRPAQRTMPAPEQDGPGAGAVSPAEIILEARLRPAAGQATVTPAAGQATPGSAAGQATPGSAAGQATAGSAAGQATVQPVAGQATVLRTVGVGPVTFAGRDADGRAPHEEPVVSLSALAEHGLDPLAVRLALMSRRHAEQADLTWDVLADADQTLRRWRELVAEWAESPSRPMCAEVTAQVAAAFDGDLDTPAALRALRGLEQNAQIPPGSKFESFLHADQLLALDLPREIGRPRSG
jgi:cysteinyl-tRNA synthetase